MTDNLERWYYADSTNQPRGPISRSELDSLSISGEISAETYVLRDGESDWRRYASINSLPALRPLPNSTAKLRKLLLVGTVLSATLLACIPVAAFLRGFMNGWEKSPSSQVDQSRPQQEAIDGKGRYFLTKNTTFYAEESTLKELEAACDRSQTDGDAKLRQLVDSGRIWHVDFDIFVKILQENGPMDSVLVEALNSSGLKQKTFWVMKESLLSMDNLYAKRATRQEFKRSKGSFTAVLNGVDHIMINGVLVQNLSDLIGGIYSGEISKREASNYLFKTEAIDAELKHVVGEYLIYEVVVHPYKHYEVALHRDSDWEAEQSDLEQAYEQLKRFPGGSDDPIYQGPIAVVGEQSFTTQNGLVKILPVVANITIIP